MKASPMAPVFCEMRQVNNIKRVGSGDGDGDGDGMARGKEVRGGLKHLKSLTALISVCSAVSRGHVLRSYFNFIVSSSSIRETRI